MIFARRISLRNRGTMALIAVIAVWGAFALVDPYFLTASNALNVAAQVGPLAIAAVGQMLVIVTGGFDVSVGAVAALVTVATAEVVNTVGLGGLIVAPLVGAACGAANGFLIGAAGIQPIIVTLGMLSFARGLALVLSGGSQAVTLREGAPLDWFGYGQVAGIPVGAAVVIAVAVTAVLFIRRVRLGRWIYMVGSNRQAATLVGVPIKTTIAWAYLLCGVAVSLAALLFLGRASAGLPTEGAGLELESIAAAVIGGTALTGGTGHPVPVLFGALFIQTLGNALDLAGISPFVKEVVLGGVIVFAGLLDFAARRVGAGVRVKGELG